MGRASCSVNTVAQNSKALTPLTSKGCAEICARSRLERSPHLRCQLHDFRSVAKLAEGEERCVNHEITVGTKAPPVSDQSPQQGMRFREYQILSS